MAKKQKSPNPKKRFIAGIGLGLILTLSVAFMVIPIKRAQAFPGEALAAAVWKEARDQISNIANRAYQASKEAYKITKDVAFKNALRIYLTRIAEDTATYIATGDPGQKPLFLTKPGEYFVEVGDAALGDYLDTISTGALGTSICDVGPVKVKIDLALRAELNPNFCTDGCQRSYESKLNGANAHILLRNYLQEHLTAYSSSAEAQANEKLCTDAPDQASCDPSFCYWDPIESYCDVYNPGSRSMNEEELAGGGVFDNVPTPIFDNPDSLLDINVTETIRFERLQGIRAQQKAEAIYESIPECSLSTGIPDLGECVRGLTNYIENYQQDLQASNQRCVRLCTGAKRTAKCTFTQIQERVEKAYNASEFTATYPEIFEPQQNEVGQYLFAYQSSREQAIGEQKIARDKFDYGVVGPLESVITSSIITPATLTQKAAEKPVEDSGQDVTTYTGSPIADAIGVFTDTLTKKLIERIFNREQGGFTNPTVPSLFAGGYNSGGISAARAQFAKAFTPNLTKTNTTDYDTLSELQDDGAIDANFANAVRQELTVEDAIAEGYLRGDWWFGYNDKGAAGEKTEPALGNGGYPASTFPILRSSRIIPVGWEIAAEFIQKYETGSYRLQDMIDLFDDESSPFYRLVDPKWVLQAPLAICAREGFSGGLVDGSCQGSQVVEINNDNDNDCKAGEHDTNNDGQCNDQDPPIYENTCDREPVCVDKQTCIKESPDGKSCEEYGYCTQELPVWRFQGEQCDAQYESCQAYTDKNGAIVSYLTNTVDSANCGPNNVGCTRYCYKDVATGEYNCQYNPATLSFTGDQIHFDDDVQECSSSDAGCTEFLRTVDGANIVPNASFELYSSPYPVATQANFSGWTVGGSDQTCGAQSFTDQISTTGSVAMRLQELPAACPGDARQYARQNIETGQLLDGKTYTLSFNARALNAPCTGDVTIGTETFTPTYTDSYQRFVGSVEFGAVGVTNFDVTFSSIDSCPLVIDDVKVEQGTNTTAFRDYGEDAVYMKDAPAGVTCTGDPFTDSAECDNYVIQCTEADVGCKAFTPTTGGIVIPGQITDPSTCDPADPTSCDQCPAAFLGCKAFKEIGLDQKLPDPTLAGRTPAPGAEFTSLVPESGIQCTAQYVGCEEYTNLDVAAQGGEAREYYSRLRQCVTPSDPDAAYYFSWVGSASTGFELKRWHLKQSNLSDAPCTNLAVSSNPNAVCEDSNAPDNVNECDAEFPNNPSCVQFFDELGGTHYRYIDEVIFVTEACTPYRNTLDSQTYYFDPLSSTTCPAQFAGCREYRGAAANNTRTILSDDFESPDTPLSDWSNASLSTESTNFPGHSMELAAGATVSKDLAIVQGRSYVIEFWAKSANVNDILGVRFNSAPNNRYFTYDAGPPAIQTIDVNGEWNLYRLGPVEVDFTPLPTSLQFTTPGQIFVDNIQLKEATSNVFLIKDTAASCDGYENCSEYIDPSGNRHNLKGFSRLCSSSVLGCEALIDTHNSSNPFQETLAADQSYLQSNRTTYASNVPADNVRFLVNDSDKYCSAEAKGCQELAEPLQDQDLTVSDYRLVYLKNNPDDFATTLCESSAVGCGLFSRLEDPTSIDYFKDPDNRVCEYRENVGAGKESGWFKKGTDEKCGNVQWTYACPQEQSTCREYFASRVYENPATPDSQSYYYLDSSVSKNNCPQGIDPRNGCIGFEDDREGPNTLRPKFDPDDNDVVLGQSCKQCSSNVTTCGRDGNSPCCDWNPADCSIDRAEGLDNVAPHYCVYEETPTDFSQCQLEINGSFVVPNSQNIASATNCGQPGQPNCFQADNSDYDATLRYCGDFACNANVVLNVTSDRICKEWLECVNEQTVVRDGRETTVCLDRALWSKDGPVDFPEEKQNFEVSSPSEVKKLANYSGLTKAGMTRVDGANTLSVEGYFPYNRFEEDGLYGALVQLPNSDFEDVKIAVAESPMEISESPLNGTGWIDASTFDWQVTKDASNEPTSKIQIEKTNSPDNFSNQYLSVISLNTGENGVGALIVNSDEIQDEADYYMLSFRARARGVLSQGIRANIYQENGGELFSDGSGSGIMLSNQWDDYVVRLNNNPGANVNPSNENIYLRFLNRSGNVPTEGFDLDDVELKPVLHIKNGITRQPVAGLSANYFQAELRPGNGWLPGLNGEHWDNINWDFVSNNGAPGAAPDRVERYEAIDFPYRTLGTPSEEDDAYTWRFTGGILIDDSTSNRFYFNHDDGARLYIEDMNTPLIDKWGDAACVGSDAVLQNMSEGWHPVKIEWYNKPGSGGYGGLQFGWHPSPGGLAYLERTNPAGEFPASLCSVPGCGLGNYSLICSNGLGGEIVPSTHLVDRLEIDKDNLFTTGTLMRSDHDLTVDFPDFNDRLKAMAERGDAVGVRWAGEIFAPSTGSYTFSLRHKDGVKFYLDNEFTPVAEDWNIGPARTTQYTAVLSEGWHTIKIEFFKDLDIGQDTAVMEFGWNQNVGGRQMAPGQWIVPPDYLRSFPSSPTGFIGRECRSYPQSDSLVCDYEDPQTGVVYRGWRGYCVERDPRDSRVCLNWWPVDVLAGEVNVFADQDQSLTRAPLYYCAETRKKPAPFGLPRYVCASRETSDYERCNLIARVDKLRPKGYSLTANDWEFGIGTSPRCKDQSDESNNQSTYGDQICINGGDILECALAGQWTAQLSGDWSGTFAWDQADEARDYLREFYDSVVVYQFGDDSGSDNRCSNDAWQDNGPDGGDDCDDDNGGECDYYNSSNFDAGAAWEQDESFPLQCSSIVQVTKSDGTSVPWTARIQSGIYGTDNEHPIVYDIGTACAPYGGLPVIESPQDIINCVPDPSDPPQFGCTTTNGVCEEVDDDGNPSTDPAGECLLAPLEIFHPNSPDNSNVSKICSETRLGAGFYSCGSGGSCRTCIGGDRNGLLCVDQNDCPNAPEQDFDGNGTLDSPCQQTFGRNEVTGSLSDILTPDLTTPPASTPSTSQNSGIARLKQIFARSYGIWQWNDSDQRYNRNTALNNWTPPVDDASGTYLCPAIDYHKTNPNVFCGVRPTVSNITVNGSDIDDIILTKTNRSIALSFNYYIDPEQRPLSNISIDWGDSDIKSFYQSSTANKIYRCQSDGTSCTSCPGTEGYLQDVDADGLNECVYENFPRIQVKDNWGWCSVDPASSAYGCSAGSTNWYKYPGKIIVNP